MGGGGMNKPKRKGPTPKGSLGKKRNYRDWGKGKENP